MSQDPGRSPEGAGKGRPGRPRAAEPGSRVTAWVPERTHDRLIEIARRDGRSVSETVRNLIVIQLRRPPA